MKIWIVIVALFSMTAHAEHACDATFHKNEVGCDNTICRENLVNQFANCWKQSMSNALDHRLLSLKKRDPTAFHAEMQMQKSFLEATEKMCGKTCESTGTIKNISYHFCRADAYKYRTAQAIQMNQHQLTVPLMSTFGLVKADEKEKGTQNFESFAERLCELPAGVWKGSRIPDNCQENILNELDGYSFTDLVCYLSLT